MTAESASKVINTKRKTAPKEDEDEDEDGSGSDGDSDVVCPSPVTKIGSV
jgi:hypothetical protein